MQQDVLIEAFPRGHAVISPDGVYRYSLTRRWNFYSNLSQVAFIMLNPSTADADVDDPTIRRCIAFARLWGYGALEVGNLFAFRATDPAELREASDPVGPENDLSLCTIAERSNVVICAWGGHPLAAKRDEAVQDLLNDVGRPSYCLGVTKHGYPRHPLYLKKVATPIPYVRRQSS